MISNNFLLFNHHLIIIYRDASVVPFVVSFAREQEKQSTFDFDIIFLQKDFQAGRGIDAKRKSRPRPRMAGEGQRCPRNSKRVFYMGVQVNRLRTVKRAPWLLLQQKRPLRHGDPRVHLGIPGYRNGRDAEGRPALLGYSDETPEGRLNLRCTKSLLGRV